MLRAVPGGVTLAVRAHPGARKTSIIGVHGEGAAARLKIAVQAPPIEGRANALLIQFLAEFFDLPHHRIELLSGENSRSKVVLVHGLTLEHAERLFANALPIS